MAYIPELRNISETLASSYDLSLGATNFTSSDISQYSKISIQIFGSSLSGTTSAKLSQSNDNVNFDDLDSSNFTITPGNPSATMEKSFFSGKYVRVELIDTGSGSLTINLLAKR